jgi:hypothetical protein
MMLFEVGQHCVQIWALVRIIITINDPDLIVCHLVYQALKIIKDLQYFFYNNKILSVVSK